MKTALIASRARRPRLRVDRERQRVRRLLLQNPERRARADRRLERNRRHELRLGRRTAARPADRLPRACADPSQLSTSASIGWGFDSGAAPIRGYTINRDGRIGGGGLGVTMVLYTSNAIDNDDGAAQVDYCADLPRAATRSRGSITRDALDDSRRFARLVLHDGLRRIRGRTLHARELALRTSVSST